jgi:hypothetical protein
LGPAGQRSLVVDVLTGSTHDLWLPEAALTPGSFLLARVNGHVATVIDHMPLPDVQAARRHEERRGRLPGGLGRDAVSEAERILRGDHR